MSSQKFETIIQRDEAGLFFRSLADSVERGGGILQEHGIEIQAFSKIKVSLRQDGPSLTVRVKIKAREHDEENQPPSYKKLKKRMKVYFREIIASLDSGTLPSSEIVSVFLHDCELMVAYEGYGDEHYEQFTALCDELRVSLETGDLERSRQAAEALEACKEQCHDQHK
ncbi:MAG: GAK system XXXCH domain-containing protein [Deltaproteobacteria bacterium]|nr:GAK system XXXCH domain-containing protein [Deltaproteobacteria bacterium]